MRKVLQIISSMFVTFLLAFAMDGRNSIVLYDDLSETSSENPRQCSTDEGTVRASMASQSGFVRQLRNTTRFTANFSQGSISIFAFVIKKPIVNKILPDIAHVLLLTTVLRI